MLLDAPLTAKGADAAPAALRLLHNPEDDLALKRIINCPTRGIGPGTLDKIEDLAHRERISLAEACFRGARVDDLSPRFRKALSEFCELISELRRSASALEVPELIQEVLERTGYLRELAGEGTVEAQSRMENLRELVQAARDFASTSGDPSLEVFLESVALISDTDDLGRGEGAVTLMTLHSAKGLEFPVVFIAGMEEGIFPHAKSLLDEAEIEEERRLCYVGMTRAKERLYLISAGCRRLWGAESYNSPSRFLEEIPEGCLLRIEREEPSPRTRISAPAAREAKEGDRMPSYEDFPDEPEEGWGTLRPGLRVRHPQFGIGTVQERTGEGEAMRVTVSFPRVGKKQLAVKYAHLQPV
jgi:DNA helicase-2/ATP-dependent DNA helicase PcrA